jgi:hypothetical protein
MLIHANNFFVTMSVALLLVIATLLSQPASSSAQMPGQADEPIAFIGHGAMFDKNGKEIEVTPEFIESTQQYYLDRLYQRASQEQKARFDQEKARLLEGRQWDKQSTLIANAALLDLLIKEVKPEQAHLLQGKNNLIRYRLRKHLAGPQAGTPFTLPDTLNELLKQGEKSDKVDRDVRGFSTMLSGQAYIDECAASGVPIPPTWGSSQWQFTGALTDAQEFIGNTPGRETEARVFKYESTTPEGACIALPRVDGNGSGSTIELLGIICLGKATGKACFWDNQQSDVQFDIPVGDSVPLLDFAGGAELLGGTGGVCTGCHAGENPFVLHPGTPLGMPALGSLQTMSAHWHDPLVHPDWPQNAGPTNILDSAPSPGDCTTCHNQGGAGRFPKISSLLATGYCGAVLNNAVTRTMPVGAPGDPAYSAHVTALQNLCSATPSPLMRVDSVLDFREVELGFAFKKALVIHNDGDAPLTVSVARTTPAGDPNLAHWSELNEITPVVINPGDAPLVLPQVYEPQALGMHTIQMQVTSNDTGNPTQNVTLTGTGVTPIPVDTVLVLDRSGSMADAAGDRRKIDAMRDAAMLYTDLLREDIGGSGSGDKLGFVKYNQQNSVYMALDFITNARKNAIGAAELSNGALTDNSRLKPDGTTGIGGAMQRAATEIGGPLTDRKQVMVVLTDGKENESPYINGVIGGIQSGNANLQMYSVGLGFDIEPTKLQNITNMGSEGYHQVSGSLSELNLFDLETFYFKIFSNATGMDLVVDPTHVVNLLNPDPLIIDSARIISSDRSANFLVLDDPVLRVFYDLEFVSPSGDVLTPGVTIGGIPIQEMSRHTYKIYRIVFPDMAQANAYTGDWLLRLTPNGKWSRDAVKRALAESAIKHSTYISPYQGLIPVGFAAAVASNYNLNVQVLPSNYLPGAEVTLTGSLSDRGWPAVEGQINVTVTAPDNSTYGVTLYDDGSHGDAEASNGTWTNRFTQTGVPGVYKFLFQSTGHNERGELAPREATRYLTLMQPESTPDGDRTCIPCFMLWAMLLLGLLLLLWIWYCCCYRKR